MIDYTKYEKMSEKQLLNDFYERKCLQIKMKFRVASHLRVPRNFRQVSPLNYDYSNIINLIFKLK